MITSSRSFEAVRTAMRRDHLMPVDKAELYVSPVERWGIAGIWLVVVPVMVGAGAWIIERVSL